MWLLASAAILIQFYQNQKKLNLNKAYIYRVNHDFLLRLTLYIFVCKKNSINKILIGFLQQKQKTDRQMINGVILKKISISSESTTSSTKFPSYLVAVHRKNVRQETYFISQQKSKPSLFGSPLLLGCHASSTCQSLYEAVWSQVTRLLSPLPQSDQTNHATDWYV